MDVHKRMFTRKVDLDYIPGLDDDLKVILPAPFNASLAQTLDEKFESKQEQKEANKNNEKKPEEVHQEEENDPKSIIPHSSMFIFGPDNW